MPTLLQPFGVPCLPLKIVSFPVSISQAGSLSSTSGTDSCLRIFRIGTNPTRLVGWGPIFPRGPRSVATTLFLGVCGYGRTSRPTLYPDYYLRVFSDMAGALRGRIGLISQHLIDLGVNPTPDHPVSVEVRCDCVAIFPRNQAIPLSITTGFCLLSTRGARAVGGACPFGQLV